MNHNDFKTKILFWKKAVFHNRIKTSNQGLIAFVSQHLKEQLNLYHNHVELFHENKEKQNEET